MKKLLLTLLAAACCSFAQPQAPNFGPDSQVQPNVPKGTLTKAVLPPGKIYPGVPHDYQVYVSAKVDPAKPAPYMIFLDGSGYAGNGTRIPVVLDNLIAKGELPPMVGIFINPGVLPPTAPDTQLSRFSRDWEYDDVRPNFSRFLTEELIPAVGKDSESVHQSGRPRHRGHQHRRSRSLHGRLVSAGRTSPRSLSDRDLHCCNSCRIPRYRSRRDFWLCGLYRTVAPENYRQLTQFRRLQGYRTNIPLLGYIYKFEYYEGEAGTARLRVVDVLRWL